MRDSYHINMISEISINITFIVKINVSICNIIIIFAIAPTPPGHSGSPVTLRCSAGGVPPPLVQWHKSVGELPGGRTHCGGSCYTLHNLSRYSRQCTTHCIH